MLSCFPERYQIDQIIALGNRQKTRCGHFIVGACCYGASPHAWAMIPSGITSKPSMPTKCGARHSLFKMPSTHTCATSIPLSYTCAESISTSTFPVLRGRWELIFVCVPPFPQHARDGYAYFTQVCSPLRCVRFGSLTMYFQLTRFGQRNPASTATSCLQSQRS